MRIKALEFLKNIANVQAMRYRLASQKGRLARLETQFSSMRNLLKRDILTLLESDTKYKGNAYPTYETAVQEINDKYNGTADWGVLQTGNIIDMRAAFIISEGPKIVKRGQDTDKEVEWVQRFFEYNDLDKEICQEYAKEAEIEGKLAIKLATDEITIKDDTGKEKKDYMISARFISWTEKKYTVKTDPQDYLDYQELKWKPKDKDTDETLDANHFVYKKFGGRINDPNQAAPKIMKCLTQIDNLDKALRDWREIDRIFAGPTPHIECQTAEQAKNINDEIKKNPNFKLKKFFAHTGTFLLTGPDMAGTDSLKEEIFALSRMISGTTGIPVHLLGLVDLMSNRATAEDTHEQVRAATTKERQIWKGAYEEIIRKAMTIYNGVALKSMSNAKKLDPDKIGIEIPMVSKEDWEHLIGFYLPASLAGRISEETLWEKVPGLDVNQELERATVKQVADIERIKIENADLKTEFNKTKFPFLGGQQQTQQGGTK